MMSRPLARTAPDPREDARKLRPARRRSREGWGWLWASPLLWVLATPVFAAPGDVDDDGISDAADAFPCDWRRSSVVYVPSEGQWSTLLHEDNWPAQGDLDFNDAVVAYSVALFYDAGGALSGGRLTVVPRALGAAISSGLALRLPLPADTAVTFTRRVGTGGAEGLTPHAGESSLVVTIAEALRPLFPGSTDLFINTDPGLAVLGDGTPVVVEFEFARSERGLTLSSDPFDLFFFRTDAPTHQVHRPEFAGTDRFDGALLGTADDGSTGARHFVDRDGLPFVLSIPDAPMWPKERQRIESAWPGIVQFARSGGLEGQSYWSGTVNAGQLFAATTLASADGVDLSACFAATCSDGVRNGGESDVDCGGPCGPCGLGLACRAHEECVSEVCAASACVPGDVRSCAVESGSGQQTRSSGGWSACQVTSCLPGYVVSGSACALDCSTGGCGPTQAFVGVALLLHMDGPTASTTFVDAAGHTVRADGAVQHGPAGRFGGAALFDGMGSQLHVVPNDLELFFDNQQPYTVEAWVNGTGTIFSADGFGLIMGIDETRTLQVWAYTVFDWDYVGTPAGTVPTGWHHVAVTFDGSTMRWFIDGTLTLARSGGVVQSYPHFVVGGYEGGTQPWFSGAIDEVRVIRGAAVYTSDFTPATAPFPYP